MSETEIAQLSADTVNAIKVEREMCASICEKLLMDAKAANDKGAVAWLKAAAINIRQRGVWA